MSPGTDRIRAAPNCWRSDSRASATKPSGISVRFTEVDFNHQGDWSAQDVRDKGWEAKDTSLTDGMTLRWQVLFPSGVYEEDSVLGVAVDASTVALFSDTIEEADGPFVGRPSVEDVENSVLVHEVVILPRWSWCISPQSITKTPTIPAIRATMNPSCTGRSSRRMCQTSFLEVCQTILTTTTVRIWPVLPTVRSPYVINSGPEGRPWR